MNSISKKPARVSIVKKVLIGGGIFLFIALITSGIFLYNNFNRLLSDALIKSFNSSLISDVYELKFKDLNVNLALGNIKVNDVILQPREKPLREYSYINSSFRLNTKEILLTNVEILTLLKKNKLKLERIKIENPDVQITISDNIPIFMPFKDTIAVSDTVQLSDKNSIEEFFLEQFDLMNANIQAENFAKERNLKISEVDITITDIRYNQQPGKDIYSYSYFDFYVGSISGNLQKESIKYISLKDYEIIMDSLSVEKSIDTLIVHFYDFNLGLNDLDVQTEDSLFHLTLDELHLSYLEKSIDLKNIAFRPNVSETALQKRHKFQLTQFSGSAGLINITGINFDSLIYSQKLFIDEIAIDSVAASIFKDKTKPIDKNRFPEYPGQSIAAIKLPLLIKRVQATNLNLVNREFRPDSTYATANINRAKLTVENITNIKTNQLLSMKADAFLENKVPFKLNLGFNYNQPQFAIKGSFPKFNLKDLNTLIQSYTPVKVNDGVIDEIEFEGVGHKKDAEGTMKFLYHDLKLDIFIEDKAPWKSSVLSFAANTVVNSSNPGSADLPPRIVKYHIERDMNKAFINVIIKSALNGLKETILMSKENKKLYKEAKKEAKNEDKK